MEVPPIPANAFKAALAANVPQVLSFSRMFGCFMFCFASDPCLPVSSGTGMRQIGLWAMLCNSISTEIVAGSGFDWMVRAPFTCHVLVSVFTAE